jgi:pyruvate,water dikinase
VEEVLLAPAWSATDTALQDGVALLRQLASRDAVAGVARAATLNVTERLAARVRDARAQAVQSIPSAATPHDVLALRLAVRRLHDTLARVAGALEDGGLDAGVVAAGGQQDLDVLTCRRLLDMRVELVRSLDDERHAGGRHARLTQLQRVDEVLGIERPRPRAAATGPQGLPGRRVRPDAGAPYVVTPRDGGIDLESKAGAKAANLAEVARVLGAEYVPGWFAVTDDAFQDVLDLPAMSPAGATALRAAIDAVLRDGSIGPAAQSAAIRSLFDDLTLPPRLAEAVAVAYRAIGGDCHVAVRSSSRDEDTERASRAGQFDTFLFVRGVDSVLHHLKLAWSGLWTARALAHAAAARGAAANAPHCGVIVQRMVASRVSGVMQTVNAAQARPLEIVINAGLGLGEGIVSGAVAADLVTVVKGDSGDDALRFRYLTADKRQRVVFDQQLGQGTIRTDTLAHQRLRPALEYPELRELVDVALRLERAYAHPLDIEFGIEESRLFVLQARPVPASLAAWAETRERFPLAPRAGGREGQP